VEHVTPILEVRDLQTQFSTHIGVVRAVDGAARAGRPGETFGIVCESSSGKSVTVVADARRGPTASRRLRTRDAADQIGALS
jgi:peptide/nickel transport system ATP-binding protein